MLTAEIIAIGDELLIGQVLNTNAQWIAQELNALGIKVIRQSSISDTREAIVKALDYGLQDADFLFITGGLGPTKDDITKHTLTNYFGTELTLNEKRLAEVKEFFTRRNLTFNDLNIDQAMLPKDCFVIDNKVGTACGMWFEKNKKSVISMPGVPYEMKAMMQEIILPKISKEYINSNILHKTLRTFGVGESIIAEKIDAWENNLPSFIKLAYLPNVGQVRLRLSGSHPNKEILETEIENKAQELKSFVADFLYAEEDVELETVVSKLLIKNKLTISTAESCTGGYLAHKLTSVAGSSAYFMGSLLSYSNDVKIKELCVNPETLKTLGAVSEEVAIQMADNARQKFNTDFALSTTGIAGPDGGTDEKPVGTVWIALASKEKTITKKLQLGKDRMRNIHLTALHCLNLLRVNILTLD